MRLSAISTDGTVKLRALLDHPMESGKRLDKKGRAIEASYLQQLVVKQGDNVLVSSDIGSNLSKNPYFSFEFEGVDVGQELTLEWTDEKGELRTATVTVELP